MNKETGGSAFPGLHPSAECRYQDSGMTLRDYFAAKVMQAAMSRKLPINIDEMEGVSRDCYFMADAMLAERNK